MRENRRLPGPDARQTLQVSSSGPPIPSHLRPAGLVLLTTTEFARAAALRKQLTSREVENSLERWRQRRSPMRHREWHQKNVWFTYGAFARSHVLPDACSVRPFQVRRCASLPKASLHHGNSCNACVKVAGALFLPALLRQACVPSSITEFMRTKQSKVRSKTSKCIPPVNVMLPPASLAPRPVRFGASAQKNEPVECFLVDSELPCYDATTEHTVVTDRSSVTAACCLARYGRLLKKKHAISGLLLEAGIGLPVRPSPRPALPRRPPAASSVSG